MRRSLPADESAVDDRDTPRSSGSTTLSSHEAAERAQVASVLTGTALLLSATLVGVILVYFQTVLVPMTLAVALNSGTYCAGAEPGRVKRECPRSTTERSGTRSAGRLSVRASIAGPS